MPRETEYAALFMMIFSGIWAALLSGAGLNLSAGTNRLQSRHGRERAERYANGPGAWSDNVIRLLFQGPHLLCAHEKCDRGKYGCRWLTGDLLPAFHVRVNLLHPGASSWNLGPGRADDRG